MVGYCKHTQDKSPVIILKILLKVLTLAALPLVKKFICEILHAVLDNISDAKG